MKTNSTYTDSNMGLTSNYNKQKLSTIKKSDSSHSDEAELIETSSVSSTPTKKRKKKKNFINFKVVESYEQFALDES